MRTAVAFSALAVIVNTYAQDSDFPLTPSFSNAESTSLGVEVTAPLQGVFQSTRPTFTYRYVDLDGILVTPGVETSTSMQSAAVTLHWSLDDRLRLRYTPTWTFYSEDALDDTLLHDAALQSKLHTINWTFDLSHRYRRTEIPLVETGQQTLVQHNLSVIEAARALTERDTLSLELRQNIRDIETFISYNEWLIGGRLDREFSSALTGSGDLTFGYVDLEDDTHMSYQQYSVRLDWQLSQKLRFEGRGGVETRQVSGPSSRDVTTPIYGATAIYNLLETTAISAVIDREVTPSYFENQLSHLTTTRLSVTQRLLQQFYLTAAWYRRTRSYDRAAADITVREDRGETYQVRLATTIRSRAGIALIYQRHDNRSTDQNYAVSGNQWGLELTLRY